MDNDEKGNGHFIFAVPSVPGHRGVNLNESKGEVGPESDHGFLIFLSPSSRSSPLLLLVLPGGTQGP